MLIRIYMLAAEEGCLPPAHPQMWGVLLKIVLMKISVVCDGAPCDGQCPSASGTVIQGESVVVSEVDKGSCREREREKLREREGGMPVAQQGGIAYAKQSGVRWSLPAWCWKKMSSSHPAQQVGVSFGEQYLVCGLLLYA